MTVADHQLWSIGTYDAYQAMLRSPQILFKGRVGGAAVVVLGIGFLLRRQLANPLHWLLILQ